MTLIRFTSIVVILADGVPAHLIESLHACGELYVRGARTIAEGDSLHHGSQGGVGLATGTSI